MLQRMRDAGASLPWSMIGIMGRIISGRKSKSPFAESRTHKHEVICCDPSESSDQGMRIIDVPVSAKSYSQPDGADFSDEGGPLRTDALIVAQVFPIDRPIGEM